MSRDKRFTVCQNCNADVPLPAQKKEPWGGWVFLANLDPMGGLIILAIVGVLGGVLVSLVHGPSKKDDYDTIEKVLDKPGVRVEIEKNEHGDIQWKIVKDETE